jgi:hypothetical protein
MGVLNLNAIMADHCRDGNSTLRTKRLASFRVVQSEKLPILRDIFGHWFDLGCGREVPVKESVRRHVSDYESPDH